MTRAISPGYTDTPIEGVTSISTYSPPLNLAADFRVQSQSPSEVVLINTTTPVDQPETFRFSQKLRQDVYAGTGIEASAKLPSSVGYQQLIELRQVHAITDSADVTLRKLAPIRVGIAIDVPRDVTINHAAVLNMVKRAISGLYDQGVGTSSRVNDLLHGVQKPRAVVG